MKATFTYKLAHPGYEAEGEASITPEQYGAICKILEGTASGPEAPSIVRYRKVMAGMEADHDPIERLRFFCSIALKPQDWLDVEPFFDDLRAAIAPTSGESDQGTASGPEAPRPIDPDSYYPFGEDSAYVQIWTTTKRVIIDGECSIEDLERLLHHLKNIP